MAPGQSKTNELPSTFPSPSMLVQLDESIHSKLEGLSSSTSLEEKKKLASDLWLNLLHKDVSLKAMELSYKIEFIEQQPPGFLRNCNRIWDAFVNSAKEKATKALANISHNLELLVKDEGPKGYFRDFDEYNDEIDDALSLLRQIGEILDSFKLTKVFAEASGDPPSRIIVDSTRDHNYMRKRNILRIEKPPVPEKSHSSDELLEKVKNSINIDEQIKLASDLWLELACMGANSKSNEPKIVIPELPNFSKQCEDIFTKLVELAKGKVSALLISVEECSVNLEEDEYYGAGKPVLLEEASRQFIELIEVLEDLDMNKVFTKTSRSLASRIPEQDVD